MGTCLPKFNIYQGTVASNCFKIPTNSSCPDFFQKKVLPVFCPVWNSPCLLTFLPDDLPRLKKDYIQTWEGDLAFWSSRFGIKNITFFRFQLFLKFKASKWKRNKKDTTTTDTTLLNLLLKYVLHIPLVVSIFCRFY